jgi:hypothetical protein
MMHMIGIDDGVLFNAFRYSLGRRTYVVAETAKAIKMNVSRIQPKLRIKMIEEIEEAIRDGHAGMQMDIDEWRGVAEALKAAS